MDYLQPLTEWLFDHPHSALLITFFISFAESLAIIGSIIPGSLTMTAVGILAGSGVMRIDLTLIVATLGAIAGDGASYLLGYTFSDRLMYLWPFRRYPHWLAYGQEYFAKHGGKSVLIGRFFGPLRSIIPVVAGMMRMNRWHFLLANSASAIGWAILYILPGILIGTASNELSAESATRLFVTVLLLLAAIWLITCSLQWVVSHANLWLRRNLHRIWIKLGNSTLFGKVVHLLTPKNEKNNYSTAVVTLLCILSLITTLMLFLFVFQGRWVSHPNSAVYYFLQSLRTHSFDVFFLLVTIAIGPLPLFTFFLCIAGYALYSRDWRLLKYWISLSFVCSLLVYLSTNAIPSQILPTVLKYQITRPFPDPRLTFATTMFGFLSFLLKAYYQTAMALTLRIILLTLLLLASVGALYLGDNWFSAVLGALLLGFTISLLHWLLYRRQKKICVHTLWPIVLSCLLLFVAALLSSAILFKKQIHRYYPHHEQFVLTENAWWNQQKPFLPVYSTNRIGQPIGIFNIQYAGSLTTLKQSLKTFGWKQQSNSFLHTLLMRAGGHRFAKEQPWMSPLYSNKKAHLILTYTDSHYFYIVRFWRSNYHLSEGLQPIWIGSIYSYPQINTDAAKHQSIPWYSPSMPLIKALKCYDTHTITLPHKPSQPLSRRFPPVLLIIREEVK